MEIIGNYSRFSVFNAFSPLSAKHTLPSVSLLSAIRIGGNLFRGCLHNTSPSLFPPSEFCRKLGQCALSPDLKPNILRRNYRSFFSVTQPSASTHYQAVAAHTGTRQSAVVQIILYYTSGIITRNFAKFLLFTNVEILTFPLSLFVQH